MDLALRKAINRFAQKWLPEETGQHSSGFITSKAFEAFSNYYIINSLRGLGVSPAFTETLGTGGFNDTKIDGFAILVNGQIVEDLEDAKEAEGGPSPVVEFIFIQSTLDELSQAKISDAGTGVRNFFSPNAMLTENTKIAALRRLKEEILEWMRERDPSAKPRCSLYLAWPELKHELGRDKLATLALRLEDLQNTNHFSAVNYEIVDGPALLRLVNLEQIANSADIEFESLQKLKSHSPDAGGNAETWLGFVRADIFLRALADDRNRLNQKYFYENVRHFLGRKSRVNRAIEETLQGPAKNNFAVLNNGVTIVARSVQQSSGTHLQLKDFQIVNGCQTTYSLHTNREHLTAEVQVPIKIVCSQDETLIDQIAIATNSQNKIDESDLLSRNATVRRLQQHFESIWGSERQIWFERRAGEYYYVRHENASRVVTIEDLMGAFAAIFLEMPHTVHSARWDRIRSMIPEKIFNPSHDPALYYAAALILTRGREFAAQRPGRYPALYQLVLAMRLAAERDMRLAPFDKNAARPPDLGGYLSKIREVFWDPGNAAGLAAQAHNAVELALEGSSASAQNVTSRILGHPS